MENFDIDTLVCRKYGNTEEILRVVKHHCKACHVINSHGDYVGLIDSAMLQKANDK